ncbi:MAG: hemin uptake protein HemP [Candidatus Omnitrophica bacterium]|nr:hemin uptake protein HemP [Candidatus Omnitrophota bacterium]
MQLAGQEGVSALFKALIEDLKEKGEKDKAVFSTEELFGKKKEILIRHGEALYRLLITRQGKLILNK